MGIKGMGGWEYKQGLIVRIFDDVGDVKIQVYSLNHIDLSLQDVLFLQTFNNSRESMSSISFHEYYHVVKRLVLVSDRSKLD
jgi:uncharacterized protein YjaZ